MRNQIETLYATVTNHDPKALREVARVLLDMAALLERAERESAHTLITGGLVANVERHAPVGDRTDRAGQTVPDDRTYHVKGELLVTIPGWVL